MKRRLLDLIVKIMLLIVVMTGLAACTTARGSICLGPDLRYRQQVYDAMNAEEAARHLTILKTREELCGGKP
jgi:predicted small secreted protein